MSQRERRIVLWIAIFAFLMRLALVFRPEPLIFSRPYIDDSFYSLGCAYNLSQGHGLTSDGIHKTNGIQPLIVFLETPLFFISGADKTLGVRLTIGLQAAIDSIALFLFAGLIGKMRRAKTEDTHRITAPIIAALLWAGLFNLFRQNMNGLETGLYSLLILASLHSYLRLREQGASLTSWAAFGALLGLLVLSRIDGIFLIIGFNVIELWRRRTRALAPLLVMGVASFIVSSPWWIFNYVNFGSIMPQSGQSEALGVHFGSNIFDGAVAIADILASFFYFPYVELPVWSRWLWCIAVPVVIWIIVNRLKLANVIKAKYKLSVLEPLAVASIGFIIFYVFFFAAWWFLYRYFQPIRILWTVLLAIGIESAIHTLPQRSKALRRAAISLAMIVGLVAVFFNGNRYIANFTSDDIYPGYLVGKWANQHPDAKIGMEQSGTASFVAANIINLDGKVNTDALHARKSGKIGSYIVNSGIEYIVDWDFIATTLVEQAGGAGVRFERDTSLRTMVVYRAAR